jgi:hypothetical protein
MGVAARSDRRHREVPGTGSRAEGRAAPTRDWPHLDAGCETHERACVRCSAPFAVPACLAPGGRFSYGSDVCFACASVRLPQRAPMVRGGHGDECRCGYCAEADRSEQRSKYTGEQD